jgi:8-oxo-dGTP pyrophosphatase MutT (NUDIX family)
MDVRQAIFRHVLSIVPFDDLEHAHRDDALAWIEQGHDLFRIAKPATPPKHLVSYFVLLDGEYVLLVDHIKAQLWLPTGGHVEPGEHPKATVQREILEELGITADFAHDEPIMLTVTEIAGLTAGHTDVSLWYALKGDRTKSLVFDKDEFHTVHWFHRDDIPFGKSDPHMRRFMQKLRTMIPDNPAFALQAPPAQQGS